MNLEKRGKNQLAQQLPEVRAALLTESLREKEELCASQPLASLVFGLSFLLLSLEMELSPLSLDPFSLGGTARRARRARRARSRGPTWSVFHKEIRREKIERGESLLTAAFSTTCVQFAHRFNESFVPCASAYKGIQSTQSTQSPNTPKPYLQGVQCEWHRPSTSGKIP